MPAQPWITAFSSGYMQRVMHKFPKQGDREPWLNTQNYGLDKKMIHDCSIDDGALFFSNSTQRTMESIAGQLESDAA